MANVTPIPSTRISDTMVRQRLLTQLKSDQIDLFRLQTAISTGRRIVLPSEDAPAAQRAISLQSLLERKEQAKVNLTTNQSFLNATDAAISTVSGELADVRAAALGVVSNLSSVEARRAVAQQVNQTIQQLVDTGNQRFRGRYLFGGTRSTDPPFQIVDGLVRYAGNDDQFQSYGDIDLLFATNVTGNELFGAYSEAVQGNVDLNPAITASTRLADLRGGQGINLGSIAVSDGLNTSVIDLSDAETVGDLVDRIQANPPEGVPPTGRTTTVTLSATGLNVTLNGGLLTIQEVGGGTTAAELGILQTLPAGLTRTGDDLNPVLTGTTPLSALSGTIDWASGLRVTNGGQTQVISLAGAATVEELLNRLNGAGADLVAQINSQGTGIDVRSLLSGGDFSIGENGGATATDLGIRSFSTSTRLADLNQGRGVHFGNGVDFQIRLENGTLLDVDLSEAQHQTVGDVLNTLNALPGVTARLARVGNGIELEFVDQSATDQITLLRVNGSEAAIDLGLIPAGANQSAPSVVDGLAGTETITGSEVNPQEVSGAFNALIRLRTALENNDTLAIERSIGLVDEALVNLNFARAELGARQQSLDVLAERLDSEQINLEETLSLEIDTDLVEFISNLTARQAAFQASLQLAATTLQQTLLDYL